MYLRVDNNGEEQLYSFENQTNVIIGRGPSSDIQVVTDGISRKHLEVIEKDGEFFVIDYGSTNGTFLNDERLDPNIEHPFNSFFPLKLGFHVFLYLVDEVSPEQLQEVVTSSQQKQEQEKREDIKAQRKSMVQASGAISAGGSGKVRVKKAASSTAGMKPRERTQKKSSKKNNANDEKLNIPLYAAVFSLILIGVAYSQGMLDSIIGEEPKPVVQTPVKKRPKPKKKVPPKPKSLIPNKEEIASKMTLDKCLTDEEKSLCGRILSNYSRDFNEGVSIFLDRAYLIMDFDKIKKYFQDQRFRENERDLILSIAQKSMGRTFNRDQFIQNNYKGNHFGLTPKEQIIFFLYDLIRGDYVTDLGRLKIKNFTYILYRNGNIEDPFIYANFDIPKLEKLKGQDELFNIVRYSMLANESIIFQRALFANLKNFDVKQFLKELKIFN